eukprot:XP_001696487.1 predicted protein [Chlamydomonas reinhardtii]
MPSAREYAASEDTALLRDGGSGWGYSVPSVGVALAGRGGGKAGSGAAAQRAASDSAPLKSSKAGAVDDDDEETFFERINNSDAMVRFNAALDRIYQNYFVAVAFDVVGCLMFLFDIYTDALVVKALSETEHKDWMITTLVLILYHYALMAALITAYYRRISTKLNVLGLEEGDSTVGGAAVLGGRQRYRWLLLLPLAIPGVVVLDICMLFTSLLPLMFFIEFVFESIPQTVLQTYIYHQLAKSHLAGSGQQRTVALSLTISSINCLKYGYKLWKAADDAGLTLLEYFKYLLLLKVWGNYECSPSSMIAVINECCAMKRAAALERTDTRAGAAGAGAGATGGGGAGADADSALAQPSQYGPAQQAYILLNAFDRMEGCSNVTRWVVSGCPLASMNRILEKGIKAFKNLNTLEVNECALRGDTWKVVTRAIKRHKYLDKVKLIQTGILTKYRNAKRLRVVTGLFKHSLRLRTVALCLHWWDEQYLQDAVELYLLDHPTLESLAIELPAGAPFAARDAASDPHAATSVTGAGAGAGHMKGGGSGRGNSHPPQLLWQASTGLWGQGVPGARRWSYTGPGTGGGKGGAGGMAAAAFPASRSVIAVFGCLADNQALRTLDLSHNRVQGARVGRVLERALRLNSCLSELRLEGWRDTFDDPQVVSALASALAVNSGLRSLSLAGCSLSTSGAITLAAALAVNSSLTSLNLCASATTVWPRSPPRWRATPPCASCTWAARWCEGAACASKPLALGSFAAAYSNTGLRVLRLRGASGLSIRAVRAAAEALRRNTTLRELDLSGATFLAADPDLLLSTSVSVGGVGAGISGTSSTSSSTRARWRGCRVPLGMRTATNTTSGATATATRVAAAGAGRFCRRCRGRRL